MCFYLIGGASGRVFRGRVRGRATKVRRRREKDVARAGWGGQVECEDNGQCGCERETWNLCVAGNKKRECAGQRMTSAVS